MDVFEQLLTSGSSKGVSPETLEYIGQKASAEFLDKKTPLNESIVKLASQHPELNNEHIHRIVEFANNSTFQHLFEKNKDKNVHFPIADPGVVIRDLRDGGSPAHSGKVLHNKADYHRAPIREEKDGSMGMDGSGAGDPESGLADLFNRNNSSEQFGQGEPVEKVASAAGLDPSWEGSANPVNDVYAEHLKLKRSYDELAAAHEGADLMYKQASADFYKAAREEVLNPEGAGFRGVVEAVSVVAPLGREDVTKLAESLLRAGVSEEQLKSRTKTAGKLVNPNHPLVASASAMMKCAHERSIAHEALLDVKKGLDQTTQFLKTAARK